MLYGGAICEIERYVSVGLGEMTPYDINLRPVMNSGNGI